MLAALVIIAVFLISTLTAAAALSAALDNLDNPKGPRT